MAAEVAEETPETITETKPEAMEIETEALQNPNLSESERLENQSEVADASKESSDSTEKRSRGEESEANGENGDSKKPKVEEKPIEEEKVESVDKPEEIDEEKSDPVNLGPKMFSSSVEMFDYFYELLHYWPPNVDVNKYEYMVLLDLLKKGHAEPDKKVGDGVSAFQVRYHPMWKSRCFFLVRSDEFADDFSFRKCVDKILPLPENMKGTDRRKNEGNWRGRGGGRGGRGGRGRRGGFRK
eukprot:TRINITY_DN8399_c0_g1_i1.p1 TRINITY_DN8399_c0_g1~~TRINITY_DN8399_c0_g1_i1.p1  ORF type:complete len:241 (-),score=57.43 TRINITY_DN8399_c0_g1_i1:143-865(-)